MNQQHSVCGCDCSVCEHFTSLKCSGCSKVGGKVYWARHISLDICPIYNCVKNERKINNCGQCSKMPCDIWRELKDPSYTDEQHEASMDQRVAILKEINHL